MVLENWNDATDGNARDAGRAGTLIKYQSNII